EALAVADLIRFGVGSGTPASMSTSTAAQGFEQIYENAVGDALHGAGEEGFAAMGLLKKVDPRSYSPAHGAKYPNGTFGRSLRQVAQLIKADVGLEIAFVEMGGWDTHANQGGAAGVLANRL